MRPTFLAFGVLALTGIAITVVYQRVATEYDYRQRLARADAALQEAQLYDAIEAYSGAIALKPGSLLAHLRRGEIHWRRGDLEAASRDFKAATALDPTATRPLEEWGEVLYERGRYRRAAEIFEARLHLDPESPGVLYRLALARYRLRDLDGALGALAVAIRQDESNADAHYLLGLCFLGLGRTVDAIKAFERAVERSPGLIAAREELADLYASAGRHNEELDQLQLIAGLDREHLERQVAVGLAHGRAALEASDRAAQERHANLAILTLANALDRTPGQLMIYGTLGRIWLETAIVRNDPIDLRKAIEALERIANTAMATSDVLTLYGRALLRDNQVDAAERVLQQATERYPVELAAFLEYASVAERRNHLEAALTALAGFVALDPTERGVNSYAVKIASLSTRLGDFPTAISWLERATRAAPEDLDVLAALTDAQLASGRRDQARSSLNRGLRLDPQNARFMALAERLR
jgi:tetratricopeptide (TPR) repeat protein